MSRTTSDRHRAVRVTFALPRRSVPLWLSIAIVAAGCGDRGAQGAASAFEVTDSAGVVIVRNGAVDPSSRLGWQLGVEPLVSIGSIDGEPGQQLFGVEDALRLDDGRILVANGGTSEVRVFGAAGRYLDSWGREGEGPGEFTGLTDLGHWPGDSIMAWDFLQNRYTLFDQAGVPGRTAAVALGEGLGRGRLEGVLPDGSIVAASLVGFGPDDRTTGLVRRSREYVRVRHDGTRLNSFGRHPDEEYYVRPELGAILRHPFRRSAHAVVWGERVVIGPNDRYEIRGYGKDGVLEMVLRRDHPMTEVTPSDIAGHLSTRLADADPDARATLEALYEGMPVVESFPAFSQLRVDRGSGDLWVREYARPGVDRSVWAVFDPDGRMRGLVETPPGLTVRRIGADYVLGSTTDELGVEYVQLWLLDRGGD